MIVRVSICELAGTAIDRLGVDISGYYVLPFLTGDRLVTSVDLEASVLLARSVHLEPDAPPDAHDALLGELSIMATWLGLASVRVGQP